MANDMSNKPDTSGTHIWLRYTTQFTSGKRTHTVEVGIPVPIGASKEMRERLIREAEVGMEQLADHMERRVEQMQHTQPVQPAPGIAPASRSSSVPAQTPAPSPKPPVVPPSAVAPIPARVETPPAAEQREVTMPPTRSTIGASMPVGAGDVSSLPQLLQYTNRELGLDARKVMELLGVKSLQGLNYREVAEQLQQLVAREPAPAASAPTSPPARDTELTGTARSAAQSSPASSSSGPAALRLTSRSAPPANDVSPVLEPPAAEPRVPAGVLEIREAIVRGYPAASGFDEEEDVLPDDDDAGYLSDLSDEERALASDILSRLRDAHGSSQASDARLKVLSNVVNNQVSDDQLEELIAGVWGTTTLKKLKNDQLEALIYWAKHADDFIAEVDMILTLLQEEAYARSDR
ncbi:MAG TPA: hypothetical protein VNE61_11055 [Ktedonobacteraceae bacterium]|nr:hypothetical protein [Ktedonobacteraceae bacterium]